MLRLSMRDIRALAGAMKPSKYRNRKTQAGGLTFDSRAEAARYQELLLLERAGLLQGWLLKENRACLIEDSRQQRIPLLVKGNKVTTYVADFVYRDCGSGEVVVEDYKGFKTPTYRLKARLFRACLGFPITEIHKKRGA
jgi:Protein of unknown function (DUF1064)